jgi:hypothetical protein
VTPGFQLKRAGTKGFKLYAQPDADDEDAELAAELSAEELEHVGTPPRFFARMRGRFLHLTQHWLRLVVGAGSANRSRWPMDPTWMAPRAQFPSSNSASGSSRSMRMAGSSCAAVATAARHASSAASSWGVLSSLELEDASPVSAALAELHRWSDRVAKREAAHADGRRAHYRERHGSVPRWVERGMASRLERAEQVRHRVQMLLGAFGAHGVLLMECRPANNVGDLLIQHLDDLEQDVEDKGGIQAVLAQHFAKVYKTASPPSMLLRREECARKRSGMTLPHAAC